jgi:hypothetical protein
MRGHLAQLATHRKDLQSKAAAQRRELAECVGDIKARCLGVDRGFLKARGLLRKPVVLAGGAALFLFLGPGRLMSLAGKAAVLVSIARRLNRHAPWSSPT